MSKKASDLIFGSKNEEIALPLIETFLDCKLQKTKDFYVSDFVNDTYEIELKSRRVKHNQYRETKLGNNKIKYFEKCNKQCFIFYYFTDGLYYIKYDKELFKTFKVQNDKLERDGKVSYSDNIYIPYYLLKKVK